MANVWIPEVNYDGHPAYRFSKSLGQRLRALRLLARPLVSETLQGLRTRPPRSVMKMRLSAEARRVLDDLDRDGIAVLRIPPDRKARLRALRDQVKATGFLDAMPPSDIGRHYRGRPPEAEAAMDAFDNELASICRDLGVEAAAQAYLGRPASKTKLSYQYDEAGPIKRQVFGDTGIPDPLTVYMHIDTAWGCLNCIAYLDDVTEKDGPYRFVPGSHRGWRSLADLVIRKAVHKSRLQKWSRHERELFANLPKKLQRKAEFGNDLIDGNAEVAALLKNEVLYTSERGDLIISDNVTGIHRGILLRGDGHRENLTFDYRI